MKTKDEVHFSRSQALARLYSEMQESGTANLDSAVDEVQRLLAPWDLCEEEAHALAVLHNSICHGEGFLKGAALIQAAVTDPTDRVVGPMILLKMMVDGKIIRKGENLLDEQGRAEIASLMSPAEFFETPFEMGPELLQLVAELPLDQEQARPILPYDSNEEYLDDWFRRIELLGELRPKGRPIGLSTVRSQGEDPRKHPRYTAYVRHMAARKAVTKRDFPLDDFVKNLCLDEFETEFIVLLLRSDALFDPVQISPITETLASSAAQARRLRALIDSTSRLRVDGIIEVEHNATQLIGHLDVELSPRITDMLYERTSDERSIDRLLSRQSHLKLVKPTRSMDEVVLPEGSLSAIRNAVSRYQPEIYERLRNWGLIEETVDKDSGVHDEAPLRVLFYGPSGTGKTLTAIALANQLGRQLLVTDVSKILGSFVGESEKNLRRVLNTQREIVRTTPTPPIFFLNECDQLLQRREFGAGGAERMYNQMMAMWLEALENMRGIVIATTNLTDNMDDAFSRRFHLKLEFARPDVASRALLWKKHIKPTIPLADDIDINFLSANFPFTGGQIAIVVEIAATEAAMRGDYLTQADLIIAAKQEDAGTIDHSSRLRGKLGFLENAA